MADEDYLVGGLRPKYNISKADGSPVEKHARYFILRYDSDPHARAAMEAYALSVSASNSELAGDIWKALREVEKRPPDCLSCAHCIRIGSDTMISCAMKGAKVSDALRGLREGDCGWPHRFKPGVIVHCDSVTPKKQAP